MSVAQIGFDAEASLTWVDLTQALQAGHQLPKAEISDILLYRNKDTLLNRAAWIDGMGQLVKVATIFPQNPTQDLPTVNGSVTLYDDLTGLLSAVIDFHLVTKWKTAGDSLLSAKLLARPDAQNILIIGAGTVAKNMVLAYQSHWPNARFTVWSRSFVGAEVMAALFPQYVRDSRSGGCRGAKRYYLHRHNEYDPHLARRVAAGGDAFRFDRCLPSRYARS